MTTLPILRTVTEWYCPACRREDVSFLPGPHVRGHICPRLGDLSVPFVRKGVRAKLEAHVREDYVGRERVTLDVNGRPIMSVTTTRDDGQDVAVYAPHVAARIEQ